MAKVAGSWTYKILSSVNQLTLDVMGGQPDHGAPINPYPFEGNQHQLWVAEQIGADIFIFESLADRNFVIDYAEQEGRILTFSKHGGNNQQWRIVPIHPGAFDSFIESVRDGKVLEITSDGSGLKLMPKNPSNMFQRWIFSEN